MCGGGVAHLKGGMLAAAAFTVVLTTDYEPGKIGLLVGTCDGGHEVLNASQLILGLTGLVVLGIDSDQEHVVGDVVDVASVLEPRTSLTDVISGALALDLDEHRHVIDGILLLF